MEVGAGNLFEAHDSPPHWQAVYQLRSMVKRDFPDVLVQNGYQKSLANNPNLTLTLNRRFIYLYRNYFKLTLRA
jgi:hypothetical protein